MTLDFYVRQALDFFEAAGDYELRLPPSKRPLVAGTQNGYWTGVQLLRSAGRAFAHAKEVGAQHVMDTEADSIDGVVLVSASGSRQIEDLAAYALHRGFSVCLIVCKKNCDVTKRFKGNRKYTEILVPGMERAPAEPPTINTCTYGRMLQGVTHEDPRRIRELLRALPNLPGGFANARALTVIVSDHMEAVGEMIDWKIRDEIIGRQAGGMAKYLTNLMHGAFVVHNRHGREFYMELGLTAEEQAVLTEVLKPVPKNRKLRINLNTDDSGPLAVMLIGYSLVGRFQRNSPAFQRNIVEYARRAAHWKWLSPTRKGAGNPPFHYSPQTPGVG